MTRRACWLWATAVVAIARVMSAFARLGCASTMPDRRRPFRQRTTVVPLVVTVGGDVGLRPGPGRVRARHDQPSPPQIAGHQFPQTNVPPRIGTALVKVSGSSGPSPAADDRTAGL
jgi:hypothetical protein